MNSTYNNHLSSLNLTLITNDDGHQRPGRGPFGGQFDFPALFYALNASGILDLGISWQA